MLIDILAIVHLILYPMLTGILLTTTILSLEKGNRWFILSGPALIAMALLTLNTHITYMGYMP